MARQHLSFVVILLVFAGLVGAQNGPPDGTPDLTGTWVGSIKAKAWDQHANADDFGKGKVPIRMDITQQGADITFRLIFEDDGEEREWEASGQIGNGNAWAITKGPDPIVMLTAHVKKKKIKGIMVIADDHTVAEAKFTVRPSTFSPVNPLPDDVSGFHDGLPPLGGAWSGKHKWTGYAMYTPEPGEKSKGKAKDGIRLDFSQIGSSITILYTVLVDGGPEQFTLTGEHGNGHFYALGAHPQGGPMFIIGHVKKKKIKGQGIVTFDSIVLEFKFTVKPPG